MEFDFDLHKVKITIESKILFNFNHVVWNTKYYWFIYSIIKLNGYYEW